MTNNKSVKYLISILIAVLLIIVTAAGCSSAGTNEPDLSPTPPSKAEDTPETEASSDEITPFYRNGHTMMLTESTMLVNPYSFTYENYSDASTHQWFSMELDHNLDKNDIVLVLEEINDMSRVVLPYGDIPFLYGFVKTSQLTEPNTAANQAMLTESVDGYSAPGDDNPSERITPSFVFVVSMQNDWANIQPPAGAESCWIEAKYLSYNFDDAMIDAPVKMNFLPHGTANTPNTNDPAIYTCDGLTVAIPKTHEDKLIVELGDGKTLISVYERASIEAAAEHGITDASLGWIFSLVRYDQTNMENYFSQNHSGVQIFAKDKNWYYAYVTPTDSTYFPHESSGVGEAEWNLLNEQFGPSVRDDFVSRNGLTAVEPILTGTFPGYHQETSSFITPEEMVLHSLQVDQPYYHCYLAIDEPANPTDRDLRLDRVVYAGEVRVDFGSTAVAYEVYSSSRGTVYNSVGGDPHIDWRDCEPYYIVFYRSVIDNSWLEQVGQTAYITPDKSVEEVILERVYQLSDIDVSLVINGQSGLYGIGGAPTFFTSGEEIIVETLEDREPLINGADRWVRYSQSDSSAICYQTGSVTTIANLKTTRSDMVTYRKIGIGSTREDVLTAYPEIKGGTYWNYEGDYLWFCPSEHDVGAALLFWFEDDKVVEIELNDMFP